MWVSGSGIPKMPSGPPAEDQPCRRCRREVRPSVATSSSASSAAAAWARSTRRTIPELDRKVAVKLLRVEARERRLAPRGPAAHAARGAGDRAAVAPERRRRLRRRHLPGAGVHRDGVRRGRTPSTYWLQAAAAQLAGDPEGVHGGGARAGGGARRRASCTATSSPTTSWSGATARCASWTSASRAR